MSYKNITTVASIVALLFGLGFVLMPTQLAGYYNVTLNEGGAFIGQLFGAALLGFAALNWFGRNLGDGQAQQVVENANIAGDAVGFIFSLMAQLGGLSGVNALGWSTVAIYLLLALAFAYLRFSSR